MAHRDFITQAAEHPEDVPDPPSFTLSGKYGTRHPDAGQPWSESFECVPVMPVGLLFEQAMSVTTDRQGNTRYRVGPTTRLLRQLLATEAEQQRWDALLLDPHREVQLADLVDVMLWVVAETQKRPTGPGSTSEGGSPGSTSTPEAD